MRAGYVVSAALLRGLARCATRELGARSLLPASLDLAVRAQGVQRGGARVAYRGVDGPSSTIMQLVTFCTSGLGWAAIGEPNIATGNSHGNRHGDGLTCARHHGHK